MWQRPFQNPTVTQPVKELPPTPTKDRCHVHVDPLLVFRSKSCFSVVKQIYVTAACQILEVAPKFVRNMWRPV